MATGDGSSCVPIDARLADLQEQITNISITGGTVDGYEEGALVQAAINKIDVVSTIATLTSDGTGGVVLTITATAGSQNLFETVAVAAGAGSATGGPCVADSTTDTLTLTAGANITLTAVAGTDTITIAVSGILSYSSVTVSAIGGGSASGGTAAANIVNDTLELIADTGITLVRSGDTITIGAPGGGASLSEGAGINISGDQVSVQIAELTLGSGLYRGLWFFDTADPVGDQGLAIFLHEDYEGGLEFTEEGGGWDGSLRDRNRFHLVKGLATSTTTPGNPGLDNVQRVHGEDPVDGNAASALITSGLPLWCANNDTIYAKFDDQTDRMTPILESFSTDTVENIRPIMAGFSGYSPAENMLLGHASNETEAGQQKVQWKTVSEWLLTLPTLTNPTHVLGKDGTDVGWVAVGSC